MIYKDYDSKALANNIEGLRGVFYDMKAEGIARIHHSEVARIARTFNLNYASGKIAARRAGLRVI